MKTIHASSRTFTLLFIITASACCTSSHAAIVADFDGISGSSRITGFQDWLVFDSFEFSASRPVAAGASGITRQRTSASIANPLFTMQLDPVSFPQLLESLADGRIISSVVVSDVIPGSSGDHVPLVKYEFTNVSITDLRTSSSVDGLRLVEGAFSMEEYRITATDFDDFGNKVGETSTSHNIEIGESLSLFSHSFIAETIETGYGLDDFVTLVQNFGSTTTNNGSSGDFNNDQVVDLLDLDMLGAGISSEQTAIPEPTAALLAAIALLASPSRGLLNS